VHAWCCRFFGGGFGGFGFGGQEDEDATPKGNDVRVDLEVTLRDLYLGHQFKVTRDKPVAKPAPGVRQCNCRNKVVTRQLGPGMFQQFQQQECQVRAAAGALLPPFLFSGMTSG
jgi:DnaJ family protein B protein 11